MSAASYRAAVVRTPSGPDSIEVIDVPVIEPGQGQIRVRIAGAAVNPVDLGVVSGRFHEMGLVNQPEHTGVGWDFAGVVATTGSGVDITSGTPVAGLIDGFDRDYGSHAEEIVVPLENVAVVPEGLDMITTSTVPLKSLAAAQIVDLLGDAPAGSDRLPVTGAGGAVGGYVTALAQDRGWRVTGLARPKDDEFVRGLGADFTTDAEPGWDAVADGAVLQEGALALVRDGGTFIGVQPAARPVAERSCRVDVVVVVPDGARLRGLLERTASGELPARVHDVLPLDQVADAYRIMAKSGVRGRLVVQP